MPLDDLREALRQRNDRILGLPAGGLDLARPESAATADSVTFAGCSAALPPQNCLLFPKSIARSDVMTTANTSRDSATER